MAEFFSINEVHRLTGLAAHTLRYYERQFPTLLDLDRTPGGHRLFRREHLENLQRILQLVKGEKLSLREARHRLGEREPSSEADSVRSPEGLGLGIARADGRDKGGVQETLRGILQTMENVCRRNEQVERLLEEVLAALPPERRSEWQASLDKCRRGFAPLLPSDERRVDLCS
jgi:DNA-binding transcriptional MerR regulator